MLSVLFNPNGRIGPRAFWRGVIVLLAVMIIVNVVAAYAGPVGGLLGIVTLGAPYAYLCVYGKRLHDGGHSAWWFLAFVFAYVLLNGILQMILMPVLSPDAAALQAQMQTLIEQGDLAEAFAFAEEHQFEMHREGQLSGLVSLILLNAGLGFIAARLPSQPVTNVYGPPEGASFPRNS